MTEYKGIYQELCELLGEEAMLKVYDHYRGAQISFPTKIYPRETVKEMILQLPSTAQLLTLIESTGYSELKAEGKVEIESPFS